MHYAKQKKPEARFRSLNLCASINETFKNKQNILGTDTWLVVSQGWGRKSYDLGRTQRFEWWWECCLVMVVATQPWVLELRVAHSEEWILAHVSNNNFLKAPWCLLGKTRNFCGLCSCQKPQGMDLESKVGNKRPKDAEDGPKWDQTRRWFPWKSNGEGSVDKRGLGHLAGTPHNTSLPRPLPWPPADTAWRAPHPALPSLVWFYADGMDWCWQRMICLSN